MIAAEELIYRVAQAVRQHRLFNPGDTLVVALSGGADSSALLDLLFRLPGFNLRLVAAHLNHSLRGAEADADEEFCLRAAARYAIPFETRRIDVRKMAEEKRLNLEDAGRRARIQFLDEIRSNYGAAAVLLAHHADDQAETVLMRLLRGSGMAGLSGMAYRNERGYVRPLLEITRAEIEQYLRHFALEWREDASNSDTVYLRNRIRHELLPILEKYNPAIRSSLSRTAAIISADEALLTEMTETNFAETCLTERGRVVSSIAKLSALNQALRRRVLRLAFKRLTGNLERLGHLHIDALSALIDSDRPNSRLLLPQGIVAVREYDRLLLIQKSETGLPATISNSSAELRITRPGFYPLSSGGSLAIEPVESAGFSKESEAICLDLVNAPFPWLVRNFRPGDRMIPFGMSGRKKVKDIFIDRKIPLSERKRIPLLFCGDELLWVAGVCTSESSRIDSPPVAPVRVVWTP